MPRAHGAIMKAARADHQALNGETLYRAGERMAASRLGADVDGTATSPGRNDTNRVPRAEIVAISTSSVVKPAAFTIGPSTYTASALTPNATASRMPVT